MYRNTPRPTRPYRYRSSNDVLMTMVGALAAASYFFLVLAFIAWVVTAVGS